MQRKGRIKGMNRFISLSFFLFVLSSCSFHLDEFKELPYEKGVDEFSSYKADIVEREVVYPETFAISIVAKEGIEEERKPFFGNIIYKEIKRERSGYAVFDLMKGYYAISQKEETIEGRKEEYSSYAYIEDRTIFSYYYQLVKEDKESAAIEESDLQKKEFPDQKSAKEYFKEKFFPLAKEYFFESTFEISEVMFKIPSLYSKQREKLEEIHYYIRPEIEKTDMKVEYYKYVNEEKSLPPDSYVGVWKDYIPSLYRRIIRHYGGKDVLIEFEEWNVELNVNIVYPSIRENSTSSL